MIHKAKFQLILVLLISSTPLLSQWNSQENETSNAPYFTVLSDSSEIDQLPLKATYANVDIAGVIADVTINQIYKNEGRNTLEAIYVFPASTNAAVYAMEMTIGDRKIIAKIEEKQKARKDYEAAKDAGKRTSLLEQHRPNVFQMNVANIMPGDEIKVSLKYTEFLIPTDQVYKFVYPTVVGPRYNSEKNDSDGNFASQPYLKEGEETPYHFDIKVTISAGIPIQDVSSPSHKVNTYFVNSTNSIVELDRSEKSGGNRDFVLNYELAGGKISSGLLLYEHDDEKFFLMMVQPPNRIDKSDIPPREYIFINDVSGSMSGYPMDVSKKIMRNLVTNLRPEDRFNVLVFAGTSGWLSDVSLPASKENIEKAVHFIDYQRGSGGTNLLSALKKALSFPRQFEKLSRTFIIVTDGYVTVEKEAFDLIRNNNDNANTFVFGIGGSVNRYLLEGMAHVGQGEPFIVLNKDQANEKAKQFRKYIDNPVLTQIKLKFSGFEVYDVEPVSIPDVFAERPIIIYGKYKGEASGIVRLSGYSGKKKWTHKIDISDFGHSDKNSAIRYLWARKKIQLLDDYQMVSRQSKKDEVLELGLKYNLLTKYTSFIAIEELIANNNEKIFTVKQPLPLPQKVSSAAVGFELELDDGLELSDISFCDIVPISNKELISDKLIKEVESTLAQGIFECLAEISETVSITITIDMNGTIVNHSIEGKISANTRNCISKKIKKWKTSNCNKTNAIVLGIQF